MENTPHSNSKVVIHRSQDGLSIYIPPSGLWSGTNGLFFFSIFWLTFIFIFFVAGYFLGFESSGKNSVWQQLSVFFLFTAIGILLLWNSIQTGTCKTKILLDRVQLSIQQQYLFKCVLWTRKISSIERVGIHIERIGESNTPFPELRIRTIDGKVLSILRERTHDELQMIAKTLVSAITRLKDLNPWPLNIEEPEKSASGNWIPPIGCSIEVSYENSKVVSVKVPASGRTRYQWMLLTGLLTGLAGISLLAWKLLLQEKDFFEIVFYGGIASTGTFMTIFVLFRGFCTYHLAFGAESIRYKSTSMGWTSSDEWPRKSITKIDLIIHGDQERIDDNNHLRVSFDDDSFLDVFWGASEADLRFLRRLLLDYQNSSRSKETVNHSPTLS